jgi:hypothetical protein
MHSFHSSAYTDSRSFASIPCQPFSPQYSPLSSLSLLTSNSHHYEVNVIVSMSLVPTVKTDVIRDASAESDQSRFRTKLGSDSPMHPNPHVIVHDRHSNFIFAT